MEKKVEESRESRKKKYRSIHGSRWILVWCYSFALGINNDVLMTKKIKSEKTFSANNILVYYVENTGEFDEKRDYERENGY